MNENKNYAQWIELNSGNEMCSHCKGEIDVFYHQIDIYDFSYCPFCGYEMTVKEEG